MKNTIFRLSLLGWKQKEIADAVGLAHNTVSGYLSEISKLIKSTKSASGKGKDIKEIAEDEGLELLTAYALLLQGEEDRERFTKFGENGYHGHEGKMNLGDTCH